MRQYFLALWLIPMLGCASSAEPPTDSSPDAGPSHFDGAAFGGVDASALEVSDASAAEPDAASPALDASLAPGPDASQVSPDAGQQPLFSNTSFEEHGSDWRPKGWTCSYFGDPPAPKQPCVVRAGSQGRYLELAPQAAVFQDTTRVTPGKHVSFSAVAKSDPTVAPGSFYLHGSAGGQSLFTLRGRMVEPAAGDWSRVTTFTAPEQGADRLRMIVFNSGKDALLVDELDFAETDTPRTPSGHLLRAEHHGAVSCSAGAAEEPVWVPLPLAHGTQVPLHVALEASPPEAVSRIEYSLDPEGNLGARIHVAPGEAVGELTLHWVGVVLTREVQESELPGLFPASVRPVTDWLAPTAVVQAGEPDLVSAAQAALGGVSGASDPLGAMGRVLQWTSTYVTNPGQLEALDALSVFRTRNASCTGYANLASAAGRIAGVPTRSVANYLVGMAQQTHSINEFWLGPSLGWRLVEPQATALTTPADYAVLVRLNLPEDEGPGALDSAQTGAIPGAPLHTLVTFREGSRCRYGVPSVAFFPECASCDNKASYQAGLVATPADVAALSARAGALWKATLARWTTSGPDPAEQVLRARALPARDAQDVRALLGTLEAR